MGRDAGVLQCVGTHGEAFRALCAGSWHGFRAVCSTQPPLPSCAQRAWRAGKDSAASLTSNRRIFPQNQPLLKKWGAQGCSACLHLGFRSLCERQPCFRLCYWGEEVGSPGWHETHLLPRQRSVLRGFECGSLHPQCHSQLAFFTRIFEPWDKLGVEELCFYVSQPVCLLAGLL